MSTPISAIAPFEEYLAGCPDALVSIKTIAAQSESVPAAPRFTFGTFPFEMSHLLFRDVEVGAISLFHLRDVGLTHDGVMVHGNTALHSVLFNHPSYHVEEIVAARVGGRVLPIRRVERRAVMLSGPGHNIYGHWLVDMLPRLWLLHHAGWDLGALAFIVPAGLPAFVETMLATFGIEPDQLIAYDEQTEMLEVAELLAPSNLRRGNRLHPYMRDARTFLIERARARGAIDLIEPSPTDIFISRKLTDLSRTLLNRERVEELAVEHGFAIVRPETLSFGHQLGLFSRLRLVAGEYGSGLHTSLFSPPGTVVCAIRGTSVHPGFIQSALAETCDHHLGYVFGDTPVHAVHQSFAIPEAGIVAAFKCMALLRGVEPI